MEQQAALRAAIARGELGDAVALWSAPARVALYKLRHRWRREAGRSVATTSAYARSAGPATWARGIDASALASNLFALDMLPPAPTTGVRGAGARRFATGEELLEKGEVQDKHAYHRLYWTLEEWNATTAAMLDTWFTGIAPDEALHPYTTSERIRVVAELLGTVRDRLPVWRRQQLAERLRADAEWLCDRVELSLGTHNHVLNNASALCCAARILENDSSAERWLATARELWDSQWPALILEDGSFAEQSSHYHVLLTRTLLEYLRDATLARRALPDGMWERARAMADLTNELVRADGTIPLFGDVTPDYPTSWMRGMPLACSRAGILVGAPRDPSPGYAAGACVIRERLQESAPNEHSEPAALAWSSRLFAQGGYLFVRRADLGLELAAHGDPRWQTTNHGDSGRGSFELWQRGRRLVVDGGMPTYENGPVRAHFRGADGQNVISLDALAPALLPEQSRDLPAWYSRGLGGEWALDDDSATYRWRGFGRRWEGLVWSRTFQWSGREIRVTDRLDGLDAILQLKGVIHLADVDWREGSPGSFETTGCLLTLDARGMPLTARLAKGQYSDDYGVVHDSLAVVLKGSVRSPARWAWRFSFSGDA